MSTSVESLLEYRQQPLLELVHSEERYVQQLQLVQNTYMTVVNTQNLLTPSPSLIRSKSFRSECPSIFLKPPSSPLPSSPLQPLPAPPSELAIRWRIIWGNWLQLTEWHSQFVEKLRRAVQEQPENVPRLFLNSQSRLRSMYMKYCENYSKAVVLVAPFKTYFEELRLALFDKNDILSRLMQPIQRVTRYQLPMIEALKLTIQAGVPESANWMAAVIVLKNLPNDVQLMLEAARIVGFPGSVASQGNLRLFSTMYVARTTQKELRIAQTVARKVEARASHTHQSYDSQESATIAVKRRAMTSPAFLRINNSSGSDQKSCIDCHQCRLRTKRCQAAQKSINLHFTECRVFLFDQCLIIAEDSNPSPSAVSLSDNSGFGKGFQANLGQVVYGSGSVVHRIENSAFGTDLQGQFCIDESSHTPIYEDRSPAFRRAFQISRHGSRLGSVESDNGAPSGGFSSWSKPGCSTHQDPFRQSTYKFIHAIKVNRMAFTPDWLSPSMKRLDSPETNLHILQDDFSVDFSSSREVSTSISVGSTNIPSEHPVSVATSQEDKKYAKRNNTEECQVPDRLWFAIADEASSNHVTFILNPFSEDAREAWLREIADITEMQSQLQLALQNPRRFCFVNSMPRQIKTLSSTDMTALYANWRCERRNVFLSKHSSTMQHVDEIGRSAGNVDQAVILGEENDPLHARGMSATQAEWWTQLSENQFHETEYDSSMKCSRRLDLSTGTSHGGSVLDIIQTSDDVFLMNVAPVDTPKYQKEDSNHLRIPRENQQIHLRRRSLSQSSASNYSQLARGDEICISSSAPSPSSIASEHFSTPCSLIGSTTNNAISSTRSKKKLMAIISSRLLRSSQETSEMLSKQSSSSASPSQACVNSAQVRRRFFRWSIIDKTTPSESPKPLQLPSRPPPPKIQTQLSTPLNRLPSSITQISAASRDNVKSHPHFGLIGAQVLRRKPSKKIASEEISSSKKLQSSAKVLKRLHFSFRMSNRSESITGSDVDKPEAPVVKPKTPATSAIVEGSLFTSISTDRT